MNSFYILLHLFLIVFFIIINFFLNLPQLNPIQPNWVTLPPSFHRYSDLKLMNHYDRIECFFFFDKKRNLPRWISIYSVMRVSSSTTISADIVPVTQKSLSFPYVIKDDDGHINRRVIVRFTPPRWREIDILFSNGSWSTRYQIWACFLHYYNETPS